MKNLTVFFSVLLLSRLWYPPPLASQDPQVVPELHDINVTGPTSSKICKKCHEDIYNTWSNSMHFQSYTDPVFQHAVLQAQVKRGENIRSYCLRCHTPLIQINKDYDLRRSITMEGVTCDFCHSITKVNINNMDTPYEFNVGAQKYGPIEDAASPAHRTYYSELHIKSEFCGGCHQLINEHGVLIMGTYTEWSEGPYAKEDIHCQNCHMPIEFDLKVVKPEVKKVDHYVTAHKFQGGHSRINLENAASIQINIKREDSEAIVTVFITNDESGHKLPTGTPARKLLLHVYLEDEEGNSIGEASETYRKVLVDRDGIILEDNASQILDAVKILSDNRIAPRETRREEFSFSIPEGVNKISANAELKYIFETPVLHTKLMSVDMAEATDTYYISAPPAASSKIPWKTVAIPLGIAAMVVVLIVYFRTKKPAVSSKKKMLVVLPFENLGPPDDDYFVDGLTDVITARLAGIQALGIISRHSALQYKKNGKDTQKIGKELDVDYILECTVKRERPSESAGKVRVIPQLIRVSDDTNLWASTYEEDMSNVFRLQTELAERVAQALEITLLEPERRVLEARPTDSMEAYEYYLQGNVYRARKYDQEDALIAIQMYEKAVELDPNFAIAYAALSYARSWMYWQFGERFNELPKAKEALDKAIQLEPDRVEIHMARGYYHYWGSLDYENALKHFHIVRERQPSNSEVIEAIGFIQRRQNKWEESITNIKRALELDPRNHATAINLGRNYLRLRRYPDSEHYFNRAISLAPDIALYYLSKVNLCLARDGSTENARQTIREASEKVDPRLLDFDWARFDAFDGEFEQAILRLAQHSNTSRCYLDRAFIYHLMDRPEDVRVQYDSARIKLEAIVQAQPEDPFVRRELGIAYAGLGRKEDAIREGEKAAELIPVSKDAFIGPNILESLAWIYVMVGEHDSAIEKLKILLSIPSKMSISLYKIDPRWKPLRHKPEFQKLLEERK